VDFTREPIIESIVTPKEGHKLVIRSSKGVGQEEYFVDAVEIVSFGHSHFFRCLEKPKPFLVPVSDYEVLEVREARMVLKSPVPDRSIKIGGGREGMGKGAREEKAEPAYAEKGASVQAEEPQYAEAASGEVRVDKKRDRRKNARRRRGSKEEMEQPTPPLPQLEEEGKVKIMPPEPRLEQDLVPPVVPLSPNMLSSLLQPPPTLISETINRYRENEQFKNVFFLEEDEEGYKPHDKVQELLNEDEESFETYLQEPSFEPPSEKVETYQELPMEEGYIPDEIMPLFAPEEPEEESKKSETPTKGPGIVEE